MTKFDVMTAIWRSWCHI